MAESKRNLNEKNVILAWQLWVLGRMRFLLGGSFSLNDENLRIMKESLTKRMSNNWQRMVTDPRNRDIKGQFCLHRAQNSLTQDLSEKELDDLLKFIENFEVMIRDQKAALTKGTRLAGIDNDKVFKESNRKLNERNVAMGWQLWTISRMRFMLGRTDVLSDNQLTAMKASLFRRMDDDWQLMTANPKNRDRRGHFCMHHAQRNLLVTMEKKDLDDLIMFMHNLEMSIRDQKQSLTVSKLKVGCKTHLKT